MAAHLGRVHPVEGVGGVRGGTPTVPTGQTVHGRSPYSRSHDHLLSVAFVTFGGHAGDADLVGPDNAEAEVGVVRQAGPSHRFNPLLVRTVAHVADHLAGEVGRALHEELGGRKLCDPAPA